MKKAYGAILTEYKPQSIGTAAASDLSEVWRAYAPLKAQVTVWRLLLDRLPTKVNLLKRNVAAFSKLRCCCCKFEVESDVHMFVGCPKVSKLWCKIVAWTGYCWVIPKDVVGHWRCFLSLLGTGLVEKRLGGL